MNDAVNIVPSCLSANSVSCKVCCTSTALQASHVLFWVQMYGILSSRLAYISLCPCHANLSDSLYDAVHILLYPLSTIFPRAKSLHHGSNGPEASGVSRKEGAANDNEGGQ